MATCTVSIAAKTASGAALASAKIVFTPLPADKLRAQDGATIWPDVVSVTCDGSGLASVTLKTGDYRYQVAGPTGPANGRITVPDLLSTSLDLLIGAAEPPYEIIDWATYQALVAATLTPAASVTAGLAAVADGACYLAASDAGIVVIRRVAGAAVPAYIDL